MWDGAAGEGRLALRTGLGSAAQAAVWVRTALGVVGTGAPPC